MGVNMKPLGSGFRVWGLGFSALQRFQLVGLIPRVRLVFLFLVCAATGCSTSTPVVKENSPATSPKSAEMTLPKPVGTTVDRSSFPKIVALGDSLTAGYGLERYQAYPELLQKKIDAAGLHFEVINAGVSGDTSAGGVRRLDWALEGNVKFVILELGGNDGLRGLPPKELKSNLSKIIEKSRQKGATVILTGMEAPPNFGPDYVKEFRAVYGELAKEYNLPFLPFFLNGVAGRAELNQPDGIHPNPEGTRQVTENVWKVIEPLVK